MNQEQPLQEQLRQLWEEYQKTGEDQPIARFLEAHPEFTRVCKHRHPYMHRLVGILIGEEPYSVSRCVLCDERLAFRPHTQLYLEIGVPYELQGRALLKWTEDEDECPTKDRPDWEKYLAMMQDEEDEE